MQMKCICTTQRSETFLRFCVFGLSTAFLKSRPQSLSRSLGQLAHGAVFDSDSLGNQLSLK